MGSQLVPRLWQGTPMTHATGHSCAWMVKIAHGRLFFSARGRAAQRQLLRWRRRGFLFFVRLQTLPRV
jgi:hypothetical protein